MDSFSDASIVRFLLEQHTLGRVIRWSEEGHKSSRQPDEVRLMREDLMQHGAGMIFSGRHILLEADARGDTSHELVDFDRFVTMSQGHDVEEVDLGDHRFKTPCYRAQEQIVIERRRQWLRKSMSPTAARYYEGVYDEYVERKTATARFAKVMDEFQAWLYLIYTRQCHRTTRDFSNLDSIIGYRLSEPFVTTRRVMKLTARLVQQSSLITADIPPMPFDT